MLNDPYCELADLKARLEIDGTALDAALTQAILAASRAIDRACNRFFFQFPAATNVYTAESSYVIDVDDLVSLTGVSVDLDGDRAYETAFAVGDYDLDPANATDLLRPFTGIRLRPLSFRWFPHWHRGVQVTGTWGWPAVPDEIAEACLILAHRYAKRTDTPLGVVQMTPDAPAANIRASDPDVGALIAPYRRFGVA